jgi:poly(A) polymerase
MHRPPKDYDIATNASPDTVETLFPHSVLVGKSFGVVRAPVDGVFFEIATFRADLAYEDGRRPSGVTFSDPRTDALRRDFTINAIFLDPIPNVFHDFVGGQADLQARIIRCVGDPIRRFQEDHLRLLRAVRFASTLGFTIDPQTAQAIRDSAPLLVRITPERIRDELVRTLVEAERPGDALQLLEDLRLLEVFLPEVSRLRQQAQPPEFHPEGDVFAHTVLMLNQMQERSPQLAMALLLHDVGKPDTARQAPDRIRFDGHAEVGARIAQTIMERLKFSSLDLDTVTACTENHMRFMAVQKMRRSTLRTLVGRPTFPMELEVHRLDCLASHGTLDNYQFLVDFLRSLEAEPVLPKPWITGHDIMAMGVPPGKAVGTWRARAYDAQLEGSFNNRQELLDWLRLQVVTQPGSPVPNQPGNSEV